jgi:hypothetical protein
VEVAVAGVVDDFGAAACCCVEFADAGDYCEVGGLEGAVLAEAAHEAEADADLVLALGEVGDGGDADGCCVVARKACGGLASESVEGICGEDC